MTTEERASLVSEFEHTWKWFELHVTHRTSMLRFLLVTAGLLSVAYVKLLEMKSPSHPAAYLSAFGFIITMSYMFLDRITLRKIGESKVVLSTLSQLLEYKTDGESVTPRKSLRSLLEKKRDGAQRDRFWVTAIQVSIALAFLLGLYHAS